MPRKRSHTPAASGPAPAQDKQDADDDDFMFDDTQSLSGRSGSQEPQHRNAANARERARMRVLSKAFCRLKTSLPWVPADTKLSKLDTLRLAASYIAHLKALLQDEPRAAAQMFPHPLNLAWPFAFQHGGASGPCSTSPRSFSSSSPSPPTRDNGRMRMDNAHMSTDSISTSGDICQNRAYGEFSANGCEMAGNETSCGQNVQYNGFVYRENYYELRNAYSDSLLNNIQ